MYIQYCHSNGWKIHDEATADARLKDCSIVEVVNISHGSVVSSCNDPLCICKTKPQMGDTIAHNWRQMQSCENLEGVFGVIQPVPDDFVHQFIIDNATCIDHNTREIKR